MEIINKSKLFRDNNISNLIERHAKNGKFYDLGWGSLDTTMIKYRVPKLSCSKDYLSSYLNPNGLDSLVDQIIDFIKEKSGVCLKRENLLVTNGSTNSIFLLSYLFKNFKNINSVFLQDPTYDTAINIFKSQGYKLKTANLDYRCAKVGKNGLYYLSFRLHNPTGTSISTDKKRKIEKGILRHNYIIEDDAYGLLDGRNRIDLLVHKRNIYVGSFSKYLFPGMRMGYIVADKDIIKKLALTQKYYNSYPNILSQLSLLHYFKTGKIAKEINHKVKIISEKRRIFEESINSEVKKFIKKPSAGFYYWLELSDKLNSRKIFLDLLKKGVFVVPGDIYFVGPSRNALRISIGRISKKDLRGAIKIINGVFNKHGLRV